MAIFNGTDNADNITGSANADTIQGFAGDDHLAGGGGDDSIDGGAGQDLLEGGAGQDTLLGGDGHDWLEGGAGNDQLFGGDGIDYATYAQAPGPVHADLMAGTSSGADGVDTYHDIEGLVGSAFGDTLDGDNGNNDLTGNGGDDLLRGFGGTDYFEGDAGHDTLLGGEGDDFFIGASNDIMDGGPGYDAVYYDWDRSQFTLVAQGDAILVTSPLFEGQDSITGIELFEFKDGGRLAALTDSMRGALELVTALFGHAAIEDQALMAHYWGLLDSGVTLEEAMTAAIASPAFAQAVGSHSNAATVDAIFHNIAAALPAAATAQLHQSLMDSATQSQAAMGVLAAQQLASIATDMPVVTPDTLAPLAGTAAGETLTGTAGADLMFGRAGDDTFDAKAGSDVIDGGAGLDRAIYAGVKSAYTLTRSDLGLAVKDNASPDTDTLLSIERVQFADTSLAFDMDGNAGTVAKIVASLFGTSALQYHVMAGLGLHALDSGMGEEQLVGAAIASDFFGVLAGGHDNAHFVDEVYFNLMGAHPTQAQAAPFVYLLDTGWCTQAQMGALAAHSDVNSANVALTGIAQAGLEFVPQ